MRKPDSSLKKITIYHKLMCTDHYLNFASNHPVEQKLSVIRTVHHKARVVISEEGDRELEVAHVNHTVRQCGYLDWAIERGVAPPGEGFHICERG